MTEAPKLDQLNLVVSDMAASVTFYRRLGIVIEDTDPEWESHHRSADVGDGIDLDLDSDEFAKRWNEGWSGGRAVIGFKVASRQEVDEIHEDLVGAGYRSQQSPYDAFWGARYAIIEDPDGNAVGIMSPVDPDQRSGPNLP
jgi:catechol 2,3-dioxygenase-like lactoylglutathione lyase family enzyme